MMTSSRSSSARGRGRGRGRDSNKSRPEVARDPNDATEYQLSSSSSKGSDWEGEGVQRSQRVLNSTSETTLCPQCGQGDEDRLWVQCDNRACETWYHVECTEIDPEEYDDLSAITWFCNNCSFY